MLPDGIQKASCPCFPGFLCVSRVLSYIFFQQRKRARTSRSDDSSREDDDEASTSEAETPGYQLPDRSRRFPTAIEIQEMVEQGLAVVDFKNGIEFNSEWSFDGVQNKLRDLFPPIFDYFDGLAEDKNYDISTEERRMQTHKSRWVLCTKDRRAATIVPGTPFPTGSDIEYWSGGKQRCGFKEKVLLLSEY